MYVKNGEKYSKVCDFVEEEVTRIIKRCEWVTIEELEKYSGYDEWIDVCKG
ncbi:MAG: hypothetical protein ABF652_09560 [Clostridium beijerinckii]